jgi:hypothetical protein
LGLEPLFVLSTGSVEPGKVELLPGTDSEMPPPESGPWPKPLLPEERMFPHLTEYFRASVEEIIR